MKTKTFALIWVLFFNTNVVMVQPKPKSKSKQEEAIPTQKEMEAIMKEMQKAMDEMSPEDKKMMDSLGIKMPSLKALPKVTDQQMSDAREEENFLVPKKDLTRIAKILPTPTTAALPAFILRVHNTVVLNLTPAERADAEAALQSIRQKTEISVSMAAVTFWIQGRPLLATYLMGKASIDNPSDIDNINNYASMLTMTGAASGYSYFDEPKQPVP